MQKNSSRMKRIADLIQITLAEIIQKELEEHLPSMITITDAEVSRDLSHAKIFVSVLDEKKAKETVKELNNAAKFLRYSLAHSIKLRVTPALRFYYDDTAVRGSHLDALINQALKQKS